MAFRFSTIGKYIPLLAILFAVWQAYGQRGIQGLMDDLKDIPSMLKYKEDIMRVVIGAVIVVAGSAAVMKFVPAGIIRYVLIGVVYLVGTNMILEAIRTGPSGPIGFLGPGPTPQTASKNPLEGMS